jgi:uncharacterized protein (TIGR02147 family)
MPLTVYDYTNYRSFLKDKFRELKQKNPSLSYRSFNRLAGIKSSGFLKLVIDGKRNLADEGISMLAQGFRLGEAERRYFELLVKFNQAKNPEEKNRIFRELSQNRRFIAAKPLTAAQYHLFSNWYYVAILEMIRIETKEVRNIAWLRTHLNPPVPLKEIKRAVAELKQLDLLEERKNGELFRKEAMLSTEDEVRSISVANFHVQMSKMAGRAVMKEKASDREFSALTIVTSQKSFQKAKLEIQNFRKKLHSILEQEESEAKSFVAQINFQLFKLSKDPQ